MKFAPKRWRKKRESPEQISADVILCEDEVELIFDEPTFDDLAELFEELNNKIEIEEERAENRVDMKRQKVNFVRKVSLSTEGSKK